MSNLTDRLDEIEARAEAATLGPWEAGVTEVSQHWSRPEPWATVVSNEVACMAYCYGGYGRGIERETDAEFIAAARTDVPQLVAALRAVLDVIGPHYAAMLRREAKFGRARSSCCCEQCRAVHAVADALGIDGEEKDDDR